MLSIPGVLLFFKDLMALDISSIVKKSLFPLGIISARNAGFLDEKHDLKCSESNRLYFKNQIDYILTRSEYKQFIVDSRSYNGLSINTDHRIVICKFKHIHKYLVQKIPIAISETVTFHNINKFVKKKTDFRCSNPS